MAMVEAQEKKNYIRHRLRTDTVFFSILLSRGELQIHVAKDMFTGRPEEFGPMLQFITVEVKNQNKQTKSLVLFSQN